MFFPPPTLPSLQHVRELPAWPHCLLWHGWLPGLNGVSRKDPWATSFGDLASVQLERCFGAYPIDFSDAWTLPEYWDAADIALEMPEHPDIGLMVAERIFLLLVTLRLLVLVSIYLLLNLLLMINLGNSRGVW